MNHDENLTMRVDLEQILEDVKIGPEPVIAMEIVMNHIENVVNSTQDLETCCNEDGCDDGGTQCAEEKSNESVEDMDGTFTEW